MTTTHDPEHVAALRTALDQIGVALDQIGAAALALKTAVDELARVLALPEC